MKNLLYAAGIFGLGLVAGKAYSQINADSLKKGDIKVENVEVGVYSQSEYGKSLTEDFIRNFPHKVQVEKLTDEELELLYLDVATQYKKILVDYGNLQKDYSAEKEKRVKAEEQAKTAASDKAKLQNDLSNYKSKVDMLDEGCKKDLQKLLSEGENKK